MCTKRFSEMKWLIIAVFFIYQQKFSDAAVVRCTKDTHDTLCSSEEESTVVSGSPIEVFQGEKETASVTEAECLPGSEWDSNCHYCRCSDNGIAECLKHKTCDLDVVVEPIHCKPNTTFLRDCNTCVCLDSGLGLCTLDSCRRTNVLKKSDLAEGRECVPGTSWKSQCNDCSCSPEGYAFCTEKACAGHKFEPMLRCPPNTMWRHECNTCWCTSNGQVICTRIGCYSETLYPDSENTKTEDKLSGQSIEEDPTDEERSFRSEYHKILKRSTCKPSNTLSSDCNVCKCSPDGQSYECTHNECMDKEQEDGIDKTLDKDVEVFKQDGGVDHIERHSVCKAGGTFHIGCNTCRCNYYGTDYSCTNKPCPLPEDVELFHEFKVKKTPLNTTKPVVCVANRMFIKDCNTCWCNEDGTGYFCTRKICVTDDDIVDEEKKVEPLKLQRKTRGAQEQEETKPKTCQPGIEFRLDCNQCLCDNEGSAFSCTRNDCRALNNHNNGGDRTKREIPSSTSETTQEIATKCTPDSVFDQDCNVCRCTHDGGHAVCTMKRCAQQTTTETSAQNEVKPAPVPDPEPGFRCNPGEQFKRQCNDCTCAADGKSVFCTLHLCESELIPKIVM